MVVTAKRFFSGEDFGNGQAVESEFFSGLKMRNGTFKLTRPSRFSAVNDAFASVIRARAGRLRNVLDIGASTGITTIELADFLAAQGAEPRVVGTDLFIRAHLVEVAPGFRVLADPEGWPLQYDVGGRALRAWVRRLDYATLSAVPRLLARRLLQPRLARLIRAGKSEPVRMETRALAGRAIELVENDVFTPTAQFVGLFDLIRAANILNRGYFPPDQLRQAILNLRSYCRESGALLLVARNRATRSDSTLFELAPNGRFQVLARVGQGSEIEDLVLAVGS